MLSLISSFLACTPRDASDFSNHCCRKPNHSRSLHVYPAPSIFCFILWISEFWKTMAGRFCTLSHKTTTYLHCFPATIARLFFFNCTTQAEADLAKFSLGFFFLNHCICMTEYLLCNHNNCPFQERFLHNASTENQRQTWFDLKTLIVKKV